MTSPPEPLGDKRLDQGSRSGGVDAEERRSRLGTNHSREIPLHDPVSDLLRFSQLVFVAIGLVFAVFTKFERPNLRDVDF